MFIKLQWRFYMWRHPLNLYPNVVYMAPEMGSDEWRTRLLHIMDIEDNGQTRLDQELEQILHEKSLEEWK